MDVNRFETHVPDMMVTCTGRACMDFHGNKEGKISKTTAHVAQKCHQPDQATFTAVTG